MFDLGISERTNLGVLQPERKFIELVPLIGQLVPIKRLASVKLILI